MSLGTIASWVAFFASLVAGLCFLATAGGREGAWRAGTNGARAGVIMPGLALVGSRYFQEVAPGLALDRAEHVSQEEFVETPAGAFTDCLFIEETSPLEPGSTSEKSYAPGIGLIQDNEVKLIGFTPGDFDDDDDDDD